MLAVIKTGGKQYVVKPGDKLKVEKLEIAEGQEVVFSDTKLRQVISQFPKLTHTFNKTTGHLLIVGHLLHSVDKNKLDIGAPMVKNAKVSAKVLIQGKGDKIIVFKYKAKKRYKRKIGHRQKFTEIEITSIDA